MAEKPEWKKTLKESNAIGWIAFFGLVVAIGVGTVMFGGAPASKAGAPATQTAGDTPAGPNYLK